MIEGVVEVPLRRIEDHRGSVMHMLRADSPIFTAFGEVYFSTVDPGAVKAWKKHLRMTQHLAVPHGRARFVVYDDRPDSATTGRIEVFDLGTERYSLLRIPPGVWYGFKGVSEGPSLIANCTDIPHDPDEVERTGPGEGPPYDWNAVRAADGG